MQSGKSATLVGEALGSLRDAAMGWVFSILLYAPLALRVGGNVGTDLAVLYLSIAGAWLATEILRRGGLPATVREWSARMAAIFFATVANTALFVALADASGMESTIPLWLVGLLSVFPVVGLVPWMMLRVREATGTIVLGALVLLGVKLAACVVARIVYGPRYIELGYVSSDWRTAKLMISLFWGTSTLISVGCVLHSLLLFKGDGEKKKFFVR